MSTLICPNCKCKAKNGETFCSKCGTELESISIICKSCGKELDEQDLFCGKCGKRVNELTTGGILWTIVEWIICIALAYAFGRFLAWLFPYKPPTVGS